MWEEKSTEEQKTVPWWKGLIYAVLLLVAIVAFTVFLAIKEELQLPNALEWLIWIAFAGAAIFFAKHRNTKIGSGKSD